MYFFPTLPVEAASQFHWKLITWKHRSREQIIFFAEIKIIFHKAAAELFIILLYCLFSLKNENELILFHPPPHSTPTPQRRRKLEVGLRDSFHDSQMSTSQNYTFHDNMCIVTTAFKWFRNCSFTYWSRSKVDLRHLGMSLIIPRTVIVACNEWSWICLQSNSSAIFFPCRIIYQGEGYLLERFIYALARSFEHLLDFS